MSVWQKILLWLSGISHDVVLFALPLMDAIEKLGGKILSDAATLEVRSVEDAAITAATSGSVTTGAQKFLQAQTGIIQVLQANNIPVVVSTVNAAIETAVAALKAGK